MPVIKTVKLLCMPQHKGGTIKLYNNCLLQVQIRLLLLTEGNFEGNHLLKSPPYSLILKSGNCFFLLPLLPFLLLPLLPLLPFFILLLLLPLLSLLLLPLMLLVLLPLLLHHHHHHRCFLCCLSICPTTSSIFPPCGPSARSWRAARIAGSGCESWR